MRKFSLLICFALLPLVSSAQGRIGYSYDAAGNRVKREIIMSAPMAMSRQKNLDFDEQSFSDMVSGRSVKIHPNPAEGTLKISLPGLKEADVCSIDVYTLRGVHILTQAVKTDNVSVDISSQPAGVYILNMTINNNSTTWKIIKR